MKRLIWFLMIGELFLGSMSLWGARNAAATTGNDRFAPATFAFQSKSCCFLHTGGRNFSATDTRKENAPICRCQSPSREKAINAFCCDESRRHQLRGQSVASLSTASLRIPNRAADRIFNPVLKHPLYLRIARLLI